MEKKCFDIKTKQKDIDERKKYPKGIHMIELN